ncbi:ketoisovalerate ferredoxin oxidoreductase subunit beta [Moorella thermoacetica]|uniref:NADH-dependent phenylglyoxylate dehydrogenase subunit beta n=2 Tax=Neomoorella thermoacetica TaxID=1525 RepID=A0A1J5N7R0_NEOTH|nr:NADH-dependent phenylglyoxylate dehydrogenase subunit beta [Moorella thermoacetica]AKX95771.1 NADH-dependent phenylglyoxylate dehydrogenase subunit beta [Moorella thermoacetica]OIQ08668.1 NADH-dependent phenylglyoxylate dehydrogenase subunit beta [Moorella thermoacetica]OIQ54606.1 NADH-dependent phenylglyoxylate dehydrogenase subunit beta [Moorella thermoacetica]OIQ59882.1 NADH-dependent phenylglyoxylate dehydrogenase subunit beta [Moorella thermoacetica]
MYEMRTEAKGLVAHGVSTCHGCGMELAVRNILDVLGPRTIIVIPPGCAALFSGFGSETALKIAGIQGNLENSAAIAAGIRAGLEMQGKDDVTVLALAGDGATVDIGIQSLSGAMERGDRILYVCYDNEAYMNTGIQASGSTPMQAWTTTTPAKKHVYRKDMLQIARAHRIPYVASASIGYIEDLRKKIARARDAGGPAYVHLQTPCPTGWGYDPARTIEVARLAVQTRCWPLYEIIEGRINITVKVNKPRPVEDYLVLQRRFRGIGAEEVERIQRVVDEEYTELLERVEEE